MVVKIISIKSFACRTILNYINKPEEKGKQPVLKNLWTRKDYLKSIEQEFLSNVRYLKQRKGGNLFYHHILSLSSAEDPKQATEEKLNDLASKWLSIIAPHHLAYAKAQFNGQPHIHILLSANAYKDDKRLHLSKFELERAKKELEKYQQEKYPEFTKSLIYTPEREKQREALKKENIHLTRSEQDRKRRLEKEDRPIPKTRKQHTREIVLGCLAQSNNLEEFLTNLQRKNFSFYQRGNTKGVIAADGTKYRLSTLGLEGSFERVKEQWERLPLILERFNHIELLQFKEQIQELGFKDDVLAVLNQNNHQDLDPATRAMLERIRILQKAERAKSREEEQELDLGLDDLF
jgi:hypothetical protein